MFFDIGPLELLTMFVIAVVVLGPDKLPKAISDASALLRKFRAFSDNAQNEIRQELGPDFTDLQLRDLHPRALAHRALIAAEDETSPRERTTSPPHNESAGDGDRPEPARAHGTPTLTEQSRA
ncbi:sec-independent translocase [Streptomyces sp. AM8-1-1]|uniref:sec-independent translocase n=1 Tax=Streptomyces sp. AM8-1-1 TaxID=3075825 RepID=UPI0028C439BF|nr:sec-independent translocase [Streptomyces sp. AM8-1-1]WNO76641.1 sec-independent translocase [Streptomyces sp. AM8-1-1]